MTALKKVWHFVRELAGETAYQRYCAHLQERHPDRPLPTEKEFYLSRLQEKYSRPNRCC
jgi:uncharacterized short protein YbdD (DUF466 family)